MWVCGYKRTKKEEIRKQWKTQIKVYLFRCKMSFLIPMMTSSLLFPTLWFMYLHQSSIQMHMHTHKHTLRNWNLIKLEFSLEFWDWCDTFLFHACTKQRNCAGNYISQPGLDVGVTIYFPLMKSHRALKHESARVNVGQI